MSLLASSFLLIPPERAETLSLRLVHIQNDKFAWRIGGDLAARLIGRLQYHDLANMWDNV